ncbi:Lrp/AsnC family transcriptional regulator [Mycobacterium sp. 21AC1]|uniref:Lrp/AsnC family transcriptional regulator n=1 Tax=[Mycobacterium] appelbergii TaxID=2939269 RepID=UPI0029392623|nr:Lrp/AsnC family transcriptional regulator [Mycobacterium sp. 21AC1]MDV3129900.1 Lrp/AsnC family transcriptional regulator [Mycobacterium sp. 21AC1]
MSPDGGPAARRDVAEENGFSLDDLDRRIIAALQINGRASWKDISAALGASEPTVARRGRRLVESGLIRVVAYLDVLRAGVGVPALVRISCDPRERGRLADVIRGRSDVRYAAIVTGPADIIAEFVVPSADALVGVLTKDLPSIHGIRGTETSSIVRNFFSSNAWEVDRLGAAELAALAARSNPRQDDRLWHSPASLDDIDAAIMAHLVEDGRRPAKAIAADVGTSESTVARRIDRLTAEGCIQFRVIVPAATLGFDTDLLVWLRVGSASLDEAAQYLMGHHSTKYMWVTAGRFNLCVGVHLRHLGELYAFETQVLGALRSAGAVEIDTTLGTIKRAWTPLSPTGHPGPAEAAGRSVRELISQRIR